jgi:hypothetical protein
VIEERWWLLKPFQDGMNDAPALKCADRDFAMEMSDTQLAMDTADVFVLNDNFASIMVAAKWVLSNEGAQFTAAILLSLMGLFRIICGHQ